MYPGWPAGECPHVPWLCLAPDRDSDIAVPLAGHPAGLDPATQCEVVAVAPLTTLAVWAALPGS